MPNGRQQAYEVASDPNLSLWMSRLQPKEAALRRRRAASGSGLRPASMFSRRCATWLVGGIAQVTARWETTNLSSTWGQPVQPISAMPRSAASGSSRSSASRSAMS